MLTPRQELVLRKVVVAYQASEQPVGSKTLAADPEVEASAATIRSELAALELEGLLTHPHTSAGRVPTDSGFRYFVDKLLPTAPRGRRLDLQLVRREVDAAMRVTSETLSQVTNLMAIVSAPPVETATVRHVEVLLLQPQVLMLVVITSTGGVTKRVFTFDRAVDSGLVAWAGAYLNERLEGIGLGARTLQSRLIDPGLRESERAFISQLSAAFNTLAEGAQESLYVEGTARLLSEHNFADLSELNALMEMLERRVALLGIVREALGRRDVIVRIGAENEAPAMQSLSLVAAGYGLPGRNLGAVSVIGPVAMDYGVAISAVREASRELSTFVEDLYG
ncbi:MAG: heat-inducible transcriptional repressor [Solirubrobacteraceae bacterium]|nr:heat-inducible transcriptional repressor [Solirubrobacteraceae bacterium]